MTDLNIALNLYYEHFGENYPLCVSGTRGTEEIIADIELCIDTGKMAEPPEYEDDADY